MDTHDLLVVAVWVYVAVATAVAVHAVVLRRASVFEPIGQYLIFLTTFTLPLPIRACFTLDIAGNVTPHLLTLLPYLPASVLLAALSLPVFSFAYYGSWTKRTARFLPLPMPSRRDHARLAFFVLATFSLFLIYRLTEASGGLQNFLLLGYRSSEQTFGRGYLAVGIPWLFVASLFLLWRFARLRSRVDALLFTMALLGNVVMHLITGNRGMLMYIVLVTLIFVHHGVRPLRWSFFVPFGVAIFLTLNLVGVIRGSDYESVADFATKSTLAAERGFADNPEGFFYTLTIGEFVVPFETLPQMVRTTGISAPPWMGISYLRAPVFLVPGAILPDRPLPLANWYMERFYGGGYGLNEGRQFFFLAEAYLNFGPVGIVLIALFWGWMWGALHQWMRRSNGDPAVVMVYALLVGFLFRCIAGDFSSLIAGSTQQSLVAALIGLSITGISWRSQRARVRRPVVC
ncbi:MAG: oligosaccharide repeat unit polymerase [Nitrospirae bacterium]|nr:oligosaccharide repeat unit polymerase [Nitrospirota bacterium]